MGNLESNKHKIVHLRDSSGLFGAERAILTLARHIDNQKFEFSLLCLKGEGQKVESLADAARNLGIHTQTVDATGRFDIRAILEIRKYIKNSDVKIIHSHDFKSNLYALLATLNTKIKRVNTAHGSTKESVLKRLYLYINDKIVCLFFDAVIVVSERLYGQLTNNCKYKDKFQVIQNGMDLVAEENDSADIPLELPTEKKIFAVVGRIFPDKGHRYFLEAFSRLVEKRSDIAAVIVGDGPAGEDVSMQIEHLNLNGIVIMCGVRSDMKEIYKRIDYLIIPSLREGLPYVLLEAMLNRVPVVATPVGDIPLLVDDGKTGYLTEPGNVDELEEKMYALIANTSHTEKMADDAFAFVKKYYSANTMATSTEALYQKVLS